MLRNRLHRMAAAVVLLLAGCARERGAPQTRMNPPTFSQNRAVRGDVGQDAMSFERLEIQTRSWDSGTGESLRFLSWRVVSLPGNRDLDLALYGRASETTCIDFYLRIGALYLLLAHDDGPLPVSRIEPEEHGPRAFLRITRSTPQHKVIDYSYEVTPRWEMIRTMSTFSYKPSDR